jgi:hypothetical protein
VNLVVMPPNSQPEVERRPKADDPIGNALLLASVSIEFELRCKIAKLKPPVSDEHAEQLIGQNVVLQTIRKALELREAEQI